MDIIGIAVKVGVKLAMREFTCPRCKRFAGTTMQFGCCGKHVCVPCFDELKSLWKRQKVARCPFCPHSSEIVCYSCKKPITSGNVCTTKCCEKNTCEACMDHYNHRAVEVAEQTGELNCPFCFAPI